ncbi:ATP-dependent sacrificial sulfur transferase LarE [Desulfarculus baarsii]
MNHGFDPGGLAPPLAAAWARLTARLAAFPSLLVAFSGGVDSALLLAAAARALPAERLAAGLCVGAFTPWWEAQRARDLAQSLGARLVELDADELSQPSIAVNDSQRCYYCKKLRLMLLTRQARQMGLAELAEGSQLDDAGDFRPGVKAVRELGVHSPLAEAGLDKAMVRALSRALGLPTADVPAAACLASRLPWGRPLDAAVLARIQAAEAGVRAVLGEALIRVRDHFPLARLELDPALLATAASEPARGRIVAAVEASGYASVCLDMKGYRQGGAQPSRGNPSIDVVTKET